MFILNLELLRTEQSTGSTEFFLQCFYISSLHVMIFELTFDGPCSRQALLSVTSDFMMVTIELALACGVNSPVLYLCRVESTL